MRTRLMAVLLAATLAATAGCGKGTGSPAAPASGSGKISGTVTVLAAASLTESFTTIGKNFEAAHPGTKVMFSFAGSSQLAQQITSGAPADVFAAASPATMKTVTDKGDAVGTPVTFVKNQLVIAVPKGNPKGLTSLAAAGVRLTPVTEEQDVKSALAKVKLGEVDAALVYRTDAHAAASDVDGVEFPESAKAINEYPIAALKAAPNPAGATAFVAFVTSPPAQQVLADAGFQKP